MSTPYSVVRTFFGFTIPISALALFFDSLAVQLNAGRSVADSIRDSSMCSGDRELIDICQDVMPKLRRGMTLCDSIRPYKDRFPELVFSLLEVGELSGSLVDSSQRLAGLYKQAVDLRRTQKLNVYDPWLYLLGLTILNSVFVMIGILGRVGPGPDLSPSAAAIFVAQADFWFAAKLVVFFYVLRAVMHFVYRWETTRIFVDTLKLALPRLGLVSRNLSAARWARSFAVLWGAGINISTALEVSSRSALNVHYEKALMKAAEETRHGKSLSDSLARTELLPRHLLSIIRTCEISGRLDDQLLRIAGEMEYEAFERSLIEMNRAIYTIQAAVIAVMVIYIFSHSTA